MSRTCECGCGLLPAVARRNDGVYRRGEQRRFVRGHGSLPLPKPLEPAVAVAERVAAASPDDCWPWTGAVDSAGYGVVTIAQRKRKAHRVAYEVANGPIPAGLVVRHRCDNPPCCNPAHLLVGTQADNIRDKVERGRHPLGERAYQARLTDEAIRTSRRRHAAGQSIKLMALDLGVAESTLRRAVNGHTWKHLTEESS